MKKSQRLGPLIKAAQARETTLAHRIKESLSRCTSQERQVAELNSFRAQYQSARLPGHGQLTARQLKDLWQFTAKLDEAITQGGERAARSREQLQRDQQSFLRARMRTQMLEKLVARYRRQEQHTQARRESQEHDENAQRLSAYGGWASIRPRS